MCFTIFALLRGWGLLTIKHIIETQGSRIVARWADEARKAASARGLSRPELMNIMPVYLASLAEHDGAELGKKQRELVENHLGSRIRHGFDLPELQKEFTLLSRCILQAWVAVPAEERPDVLELDKLLEIVHESGVLVADMFVRHLLDDAQSEKRFFRLIRQAFSGPHAQPGVVQGPLSERLCAALPLVMEAIDAATAAILLYEPQTRQLVMTASAGIADETFTRYAQSLATSSFAGLVASREETTTIVDVETTELDVTPTLRHSGIHALLGVRVPLQRELLGVMYVGIREHRSFSARERGRLEAIAEHLALLIENAQLNSELEKQIQSLQAEQKVREGVASILAHDIRGPLSAARVAVQMLSRDESDAKKLHWIDITLRSLDRGSQMVSDLLDAERIHAGQHVAISRQTCDLTAIVRDVIDELALEHGNRFVVDAPVHAVDGNWGREELRRAMWNLATNALKYGSSNAPVTITVRGLPQSAELDVHNEGPPIAPEQHARMFQPFVRMDRPGPTAGGWGLGLAVVRGIVDAHGGSVSVDSTAERGTTFTIRIPRH